MTLFYTMGKFWLILIIAAWFDITVPIVVAAPASVPIIYIAKCNGNSYTVVKNSVYDGSKIIYRIPPGTNYHLQGCTVYFGNKPAYDIKSNKRYIPSYKRKRKVPDRVLYVENGKLIKVAKGRVYIGDFRAYRDDDLKKGTAHVYYKDGNLYINDNVVMKKNPAKPEIKIPAIVNLNLRDVSEFQIKMKKSRMLQYNDKKGEQVFMSIQ